MQMIRIVPYGEEDEALYGIIVEVRRRYGSDDEGLLYNAIEVLAIGTEALLDSRESYTYSGGTVQEISIAAGKADDEGVDV